jgi:hypothetical protein
MGKYLQDIEFRNDPCVRKMGLLEEARTLSPDLNAIESYFNKHLPKKLEVGNQIWRFIIWLTPIEEKEGKTEVAGLCQDYYAFIDFKKILQLDDNGRAISLLEIYKTGIEKCCEANNYTNHIFQEIYWNLRVMIEKRIGDF